MAACQALPSLEFSRQEHWSGLPFPSPVHENEKWKWSHSFVSDSVRPHGLQPTRLLRPWDFPGKSTGVGCHCLLRARSWGTFKNNVGFGSGIQLNYRGQVGPFKACSFSMGFPGGTGSKEPTCQCRRHKRCGFDPWVEKIPWRGKWQPTPVFLPGKSHGQRSLAGYSPWGCKESDTTEVTECRFSAAFHPGLI